MCHTYITTNEDLFGNANSSPAAQSAQKSHPHKFHEAQHPTQFPLWQPPNINYIKSVIHDGDECIVCHRKHNMCTCGTLAKEGYDIVKDKDASTEVIDNLQFNKEKGGHVGGGRGYSDGRGSGGCGGHGDRTKKEWDKVARS